MIKINDRNINDIFKDDDIIEKYRALISFLYGVFIQINNLEDSLETKVHFTEAVTLFLRLNSHSLFNDDELSDSLKNRYSSNKALVSYEDMALELEPIEDTGINEFAEYLSYNYTSIKKELYLYAKKLYCEKCSYDDFYVYMSNLIKKSIQALVSYEGKTILTNTILLGLYLLCKNMSITGVFKSSDISTFFDEANCN